MWQSRNQWRKVLFTRRKGGTQWTRAFLRTSTRKASQWKGRGDSVNWQTRLWELKFSDLIPFAKVSSYQILVVAMAQVLSWKWRDCNVMRVVAVIFVLASQGLRHGAPKVASSNRFLLKRWILWCSAWQHCKEFLQMFVVACNALERMIHLVGHYSGHFCWEPLTENLDFIWSDQKLKFPNVVVLNAVRRRRVQMSA